jgi:O-acetyl-ADP-ribose deacetylase (regulator of RNase III)
MAQQKLVISNSEWKLKYVNGDLLKLFAEKEFDVIGHGCNCFCVMGGGIAKTIKSKYPGVYALDKTTKKGDIKKLGTCGVFQVGDQFIVNCYTEYNYREKNPLDYPSLEKCMRYIKSNFSGRKIGFPKIGAGLAGGDWKKIEKIIIKELKGENVTIVVYGK